MSHHLILLSIGPVQSFIAQARKLRDLRSGSQLLSELTKTVITAFEEAGGTVIVPGNTKSDSLPNRMLGSITDRTDNEVTQLARQLESAINDHWSHIVDQTIQQLLRYDRPGGWEARFREQTEQFLEVYWAVEPYGGESDYPRGYRAIEARLGAVKNARTFLQIGSAFGGDETSRKDALTGERDALVFGHHPHKGASGYPAGTDPGLPIRLNDRGPLIGPNEGLSAISAVKRFRDLADKAFHATADVALLGLDNKIPRGIDYMLKEFYEENDYGNKQGDGQLLYVENLNTTYFKQQGISEKELPHFVAAHKRFKNTLNKYEMRQTPYYAVLAFDGDNMGAWLSGKKLPKQTQQSHLREFHSAIGERLAAFASAARQLVDDENRGITVYTGGDDYLGLLTLDGLFEVLQSLRRRFDELVSQPLRGTYGITKNFTFSAGVVVAHYKRPLGDTVQLALKAEKAAKDAGRDALCLRVVKRSGEQQQATFPWKLDADGTSASLATLQQLTSLLQGNYGRTWLTESARTVRQLFGNGAIKQENRALLEAELARLLRRTLSSGTTETIPAEKAATVGQLQQLIELSSTGDKGAENLVFSLQLIDFFKRHMNTLRAPATAAS